MDLLKLNEIPDYEIGAPYYDPDIKWTTMFNYDFEDRSKRKENELTWYPRSWAGISTASFLIPFER